MIWLKRTWVVVFLLMLAFPACAFTFLYGDLFSVEHISNADGNLQMPLSRKKYKNVKILSKELYRFLKSCPADCAYPSVGRAVEIVEIRAAKSQPNMLIAEVAFNEQIQLTFLLFKEKKGVSVKFPNDVIFQDKKFKQQIQAQLEARAAEVL